MEEKQRNHEDIYRKIVALYDLGENVLDALENEEGDIDRRIGNVEVLMEQLHETVGMLSALYLEYASSGKLPEEEKRQKASNAMRRLQAAIDKCESEE